MGQKSESCATSVVRKIIDSKTIGESSKEQEMRIINAFEKFLESISIEDNLSNMTLSTIEKYQSYLLGKGRKVKTIRCYIATIIHLLKLVSRYKEYDYNFAESGLAGFQLIANKISKNERKKKQIALTDEEVIKLYNFSLKPAEEEIKDVFVCQCLLGQRIGDMARLFAKEYTIEKVGNVEVITFIQQKTKERVVIPLLPIARTILEKYKDGFKHINFSASRFDNNINRKIKVIGKKIGLDKAIYYSEQKGTIVTEKVKKQYELLHTHTARHTFITIMCRLGVKKETLIIATGHTDTKMIDDVYSHLDSEDNAKAIVEAFSGLQGKIFNMGKSKDKTIVNTPATDNTTLPIPIALIILSDLQKAKELLAYLGNQTAMVMDLNTVERNAVLNHVINKVRENL